LRVERRGRDVGKQEEGGGWIGIGLGWDRVGLG
jgi:hypothetical protein